jgi:hypothetical protein
MFSLFGGRKARKTEKEKGGGGRLSRFMARLFDSSDDDVPPARAAPPPPPAVPASVPAAAPGDDLMRIIGLQQLDGSWADVARLLEVAGTQIHNRLEGNGPTRQGNPLKLLDNKLSVRRRKTNVEL